MLTYYAALSLDGRIAGDGHDLSFLQTLTGAENDYEVFYADVDSLIMGARTWDFMVAHGSWPYAGKPTWIVTHARQLAELPGAEPVEVFGGEIGELTRLIEARGLKRTWLVGGGDFVGEFSDRGLLDEIILGIAPVTLGAGAPPRPRRLSAQQMALTHVAQMGQFAYLSYAVGSLAKFGRHKAADILAREPVHH